MSKRKVEKIVDELDLAIENAVMRIDEDKGEGEGEDNEHRGGGYAILFSGGLDSSLLAKVSEDLGKTPLLVSVAVKGSPDFTFIKKAAGHFKSRLAFNDIESHDLARLARDVVTATGDRSPLQVDIGIPIYAACKAAKDSGISLVVAGQGADEQFGGYHRYLDMGKDEFENALSRDLMNIERDNLRRDNAIAAATGVRFALPYLDREVVSLAGKIPAELKIKDGIRKYVLTEVARKRGLPDIIVKKSDTVLDRGGQGVEKDRKGRG